MALALTADQETFIRKLAKRRDEEAKETLAAFFRTGASRVNALYKYADRVKAGKVGAKAKVAKPKAKAKPKK